VDAEKEGRTMSRADEIELSRHRLINQRLVEVQKTCDKLVAGQVVIIVVVFAVAMIMTITRGC
jgi:hypothetical protein